MTFLKKHQTPVFLFVIAAVLATFVFFSMPREKDETGFLRQVTLETASPFQRVFAAVFEGLRNTWERYLFLVGLEEENRMLRRRVSLLEAELSRSDEIRIEHNRLLSLLGLKKEVSFSTVTARVISRDRTSLFRSFVIDRGSRHGVSIGSPVLSAEGVVGKVMDVSWNAAKVLLINDFNCRIDAYVRETRARGILQGRREGDCTLKYVPRSESVREGDTVVTSGLAGGFPKGMRLGTVIQVARGPNELFQNVRVRPTANIGKVEEVLVIVTETRSSGKDDLQ